MTYFQKLILFAFSTVLLFASCKNHTKEKIDRLPEVDMETLENLINNPQTAVKDTLQKLKTPKILIENPIFDFGTLVQGEAIEHSFDIKNIGLSNLLILDTKTSCGCTVVAAPSEPIKAGATSQIKAIYNSKGKMGTQSRKITIFTNSYPGTYILEIKGEVVLSKG